MRVYENGSPLEIPDELIVFTDRSRIMDGRECESLRFLGFEAGPSKRGVRPRGGAEELAIGQCVHAGIEEMCRWAFWGELSETAHNIMLRDSARNARIRFEWTTNEVGLINLYPLTFEEGQRHVLWADAASLVEALVYGFGLRILPRLRDEYTLEALEEEIPWVLGRWVDGRVLVMMTRCDLVLRGPRGLVVGEVKTAKEWRTWKLEEVRIDTQGLTQLEAVAQRYGEEPEGTIYFGLLKGSRRLDDATHVERSSTSLIRPWTRLERGEQLELWSDVAWSWDWLPVGEAKARKLGTKWERRSLGDLGLTVARWLEAVESGEICQPGETTDEDWLAESFIFGDLIQRPQDVRARWRDWANRNEWEWDRLLVQEREWAHQHRPEGVWLNSQTMWPLWERETDTTCHKFGRRCGYYDLCHGDKSVEIELANNRWEERIPNHPTEEGEQDAGA